MPSVTGMAFSNPTAIPASTVLSWEALGVPGLAWINLWKNRPCKQKSKVESRRRQRYGFASPSQGGGYLPATQTTVAPLKGK